MIMGDNGPRSDAAARSARFTESSGKDRDLGTWRLGDSGTQRLGDSETRRLRDSEALRLRNSGTRGLGDFKDTDSEDQSFRESEILKF